MLITCDGDVLYVPVGAMIANNYSASMSNCENCLMLSVDTGLCFSFILFKMATPRKRKALKLETTISILHKVEKGQSPKKDIAKKFDIPQSTPSFSFLCLTIGLGDVTDRLFVYT